MKKQRPLITEMARAHAARCMLDAMHGQMKPEDYREAELAAFMAIFHPEKRRDKNDA